MCTIRPVLHIRVTDGRWPIRTQGLRAEPGPVSSQIAGLYTQHTPFRHSYEAEVAAYRNMSSSMGFYK